MKKTVYYFKANSSKVDDKERFRRQVNLVCMRIKEQTGYRGIFDITSGYNDNDFVNNKITVTIKTDRIQ